MYSFTATVSVTRNGVGEERVMAAIHSLFTTTTNCTALELLYVSCISHLDEIVCKLLSALTSCVYSGGHNAAIVFKKYEQS